ncbi:MAG: hypothetical protein RR865_04965 [Clostridia bacterium]
MRNFEACGIGSSALRAYHFIIPYQTLLATVKLYRFGGVGKVETHVTKKAEKRRGNIKTNKLRFTLAKLQKLCYIMKYERVAPVGACTKGLFIVSQKRSLKTLRFFLHTKAWFS